MKAPLKRAFHLCYHALNVTDSAYPYEQSVCETKSLASSRPKVRGKCQFFNVGTNSDSIFISSSLNLLFTMLPAPCIFPLLRSESAV